MTYFRMMQTNQAMPYKNAVLDDRELQDALKSLNPNFGDFVTRVAGEIDQKTKAH